jgi:hypothetical protein
MRSPESIQRRRLFAGIAGLLVTGTLAGCTGDSDTDENGDGNSGDGENGTDATETPSNGPENGGASTETPATDELDLREANVVGVSVDHEGGDSYRFDVTLHHDDDGEDGYANWWQVESLDGSKLGRRELLHAHSQQPFTRSESIEVTGDTCVVVRGHDQTHGYGGGAMVVDVESGETDTVRQGGERQPIDQRSCQ